MEISLGIKKEDLGKCQKGWITSLCQSQYFYLGYLNFHYYSDNWLKSVAINLELEIKNVPKLRPFFFEIFLI